MPPIQSGPFRVPAFNDFVPRRLQPWIYLCFAACFQLSGGRYLGALDYMVGEESLMRQDLMMCLYCNLAGMATYFPLFFRMKFRFTNKTLLMAAATGVLVCNLLIPYVNFLPLLWLLCFIEGACKLQGTFECVSNVQLWITPQRDFTVFFPVLHIFILGMLNITNWLAVYYAFGWDDWRLTHWFIAGLMLVILLLLRTCTHHARIMPKVPLRGIDWVGYAEWNAFLFQIAYLLDYGDWMNWYDSPSCWLLTGTILINLALILHGAQIKPHAYISRKIFKFRHVIIILILVTLFEVILATENVLEEVFIEAGPHFSAWELAPKYFVILGSILFACGFALWWMKMHKWSYTRLGLVAACQLFLYLLQMYFLIDPDVTRTQLYLPIFTRTVATVLISIMLMTHLNYMMDFHTFFIGLSVFNMIHMFAGGAVGGAIFTQLFKYATADVYGDYQPVLISLQRCYGVALYASLAIIAAFLIYDMPARRYRIHRMMPWRNVGRQFLSPFVRRHNATAPQSR